MVDTNSSDSIHVKETDMSTELVRSTIAIVGEAVGKFIQDKVSQRPLLRY